MKHRISASMFIKIFTAFVLIMVIPVLIISITYYYYTLSFFKKEVFDSSAEKLYMAKSFVEASLDEVQNDAKQIALSNSLEKLNKLINNNHNDSKNILTVSDVLELLYNTKLSNNNIHSIYIYDYNNEIIYFSDKLVFNKYEFFDTDWIDSYRNQNNNILWIGTRDIGIPITNQSSAKSGLAGTNRVITMVYPAVYISSFQGLLVINIKAEELSKVLGQAVLKPTGEITVINSDGHVILSSKKELVTTNISEQVFISEILSSVESFGSVQTQINKENYIFTYTKSDYNGWIYINEYSIQKVLTNFNMFRSMIYIAAFIMTSVGIPVCYFISRNLYNPVKSIVEKIRLEKGIPAENNKNEMTVISNALNDLLKQGNQIHNFYENNKKKLLESSLLSLIRGNTDSDVLQHLPFEKEYFSCVIITVDNSNSVLRRFSSDERYYVKELILKLFLEMMDSVESEPISETRFKCAGVQYEKESMVIVINMRKENISLFKSHIISLFNETKDKVYEVFDGTVTITIGNCYKGCENVETSFDDAKNLVKYRMLYGSDKIISAWNTENNPNIEHYYPASTEKHIFNYLKLGMLQELMESTDVFFDEIHKRNLSYDNILQIINQLVGGIVKYMLSEHLNPSEVFSTNKTLYQHLSSLETLDEVQQWTKNIFTSVVEYTTIRNSSQNKYTLQVQDYVQEHYSKYINFEELAKNIGVSYSYLRRLFNEELNMSLTNYLNTYRIEKAKEILKNSSFTLQKVALSIGYSNVQSFKRYFKKYEGITPSEFRKI